MTILPTEQDDLVELLPCPHCGAEPSLTWGDMVRAFQVSCEDGCGASGAYCTLETDAIDSWNRRASDPRIEQLERGLAETKRLSGFGSIVQESLNEAVAGRKRATERAQDAERALSQSQQEAATLRQQVAELEAIRRANWDATYELGKRADELVAALTKIAAFNDALGSTMLAETGRYSSFDEPASVEIARSALSQPIKA